MEIDIVRTYPPEVDARRKFILPEIEDIYARAHAGLPSGHIVPRNEDIIKGNYIDNSLDSR